MRTIQERFGIGLASLGAARPRRCSSRLPWNRQERRGCCASSECCPTRAANGPVAMETGLRIEMWFSVVPFPSRKQSRSAILRSWIWLRNQSFDRWQSKWRAFVQSSFFSWMIFYWLMIGKSDNIPAPNRKWSYKMHLMVLKDWRSIVRGIISGFLLMSHPKCLVNFPFWAEHHLDI